MKTDSIAIKYSVLDANGHDGDFCGKRYMLVSLPNVDKDPAYAIVDEYGEIQTIATDRKTINTAWQALTAISYDNHGLPEDLATELRETIRRWLSDDLADYPLNWQVSNMFAIFSDYLRPFYSSSKSLTEVYKVPSEE